MRLAPLLVASGTLLLAGSLGAQRSGGGRGGAAPARPPAVSPAQARANAVRAELAEMLLQSKRYEEAASEYRLLVEADSTNASYRLGLAQAFAWGGRYREAERELRVLTARRPRPAAADTLLRTVRVSLRPDVREATEWVAEQPRYAPYRIALARALVRAGQLDAALAQNDTLLGISRTPAALVERARTNIARRDLVAAEADLGASIALGATADAFMTLGDLYRWRADLAGARSAYDRARALTPDDRAITLRYAQLVRDERPIVTFGSAIDLQPGWRTAASFASDRAGTRYTTISAHRGFVLPLGLIGGAGIGVRDLREQLADRDAHTTGYSVDAGLSRDASYGAWYGQLGALGGVVHHPGIGSQPFGAAAATARYYAWTMSGEIASGPAYPLLLTTAWLTPEDASGRWLTERAVTFSVAGPFRDADIGASVRQSELSDGNRRSVIQLFGRYPLMPRVSVIYGGSSTAFAARSLLYWDPEAHVTTSVGLQLAEQRAYGLSYAMRFFPGVAWAEDSPYRRTATSELGDRQMRFQVSTGGDVTWRANRWEAAASWGWGRLGDYSRIDGRMGVRFIP